MLQGVYYFLLNQCFFKALLQVAVCRGTGGSWQLDQNALRCIKEGNPSQTALQLTKASEARQISFQYLPAAISSRHLLCG